jgi:hypothetical protein
VDKCKTKYERPWARQHVVINMRQINAVNNKSVLFVTGFWQPVTPHWIVFDRWRRTPLMASCYRTLAL